MNCNTTHYRANSSSVPGDPTPLPAANFTFTQSGAVGGATFTTASTLPTGVTLSTAGVLSGTPGQGGAFVIDVTVTDGNGCTGTSSGYTLTVTCPTIIVTNPGVNTGTANTPFSQTFTQSGGVGTLTWSESGTLPAGLTLNASSGVLSGTPTQTGSFPITVTATDQNGCQGTGATYNLTIACQTITVTNPATNSGTANAAFSQTFTASNTIGSVIFTTASTLPAGLTLASSGTLSGTPTQTGTFPIVVTATDANGCPGTGSTYSLTINCQTITVTNPAVNAGTVNVPFSQAFNASNTIGTTTFTTASTLPVGLTLATNGTLSGVPMQTGTFPIVVTATDVNGCSGTGATYSLTITCQVISVTNPINGTGTVNAAFSEQFTASNTIGTVTFNTASTLPAGLTLDTSTGVLSGTPTQPGSFPIVVTATDANGCTGTGPTYNLTINCQVITVTNPTDNTIAAGTPLPAANFTFTQSGAVGGATFTTASTLPIGITLSTAGVLSGIPMQGGAFPITVTVTDGNGCTGTSSGYVLTITCPTITVTNPAVSTGTANVAFSQTFTQSGGAGTITWSESGTLPTGITLDSATGILSGTTLQVGTFPIVVTATDQNGCQGTGPTYNLVIACPTITPSRNGGGSFPAGTFNTAYNGQSFTASPAPTGTYSFAVTGGTFPAGLTLSSGGAISGTPTATGTFAFTVTATDSGSACTGSAGFSIAIQPSAGNDSYSNLVNNTQAVVTGGTTTSPTTPFVALTGTITSNDSPAGVPANAGTFSTTQGGSVTIATDGTFIYTPPVTASPIASDTFTYTIVSDTGGTGTPVIGTGTVTLNLSGRVWYVNNSGSNGNGQSQSPFNSLSNFTNGARVSPDAANDIIYVYNGDGTTTNQTSGVVLLSGEQLIGEGVALVVNGNNLVAAGTKPQITNTVATSDVVTLNDGNTIKGVTITGATRDGIAGSAHAGLTIDTVTIQNDTAAGLHLTNMTGTVSVTNAAITGNGSGININGGTAAITVDALSSITQNLGSSNSVAIINRPNPSGAITIGATITDNGAGISVPGNAAGSGIITFSGPITINTATAPIAAVDGTSNGTTVRFTSGSLSITTTGTTKGFFFNNGGGTVEVTGANNTVSTQTGIGVQILNNLIGANGVTFKRIDVNGAANGIVLGATVVGTFTVTGDGVNAGSGGTIQNTTNTAVQLGAVTSLSFMNISGVGGIIGGGTVTVNTVSVSGTSFALLLSNAAFTPGSTFSSVSGTNSAALSAVSLTTDTGSFTVNGGSITAAGGTTGALFNVNGGTVSFTWNGSLTQGQAAPMITITNHATGTLTFQTGTLQATNGNGIQFSNADGAYNFNGPTTLSGGAQVNIAAGTDAVNGSQGSFTFGSGTGITGGASAPFAYSGSVGNVTFSGTISQATGGQPLVSVVTQKGGTITFQTGTLTATGGSGVQMSAANGTVNFNGVVTIDGTTSGVNIAGTSTGTINFSNAADSIGTTIPPAGAAFTVSTGTQTVAYAGTLRQTNPQNAVSISSTTGGTITFSGNVTANTTLANAINLTSNSGVTVAFTSGNLAITTTNGNGINATGSGTLSITGANNTISTTGSGAAVSIVGTAGTHFLGSQTFKSINKSGSGTKGIVVNFSDGSFTVTGTGAAGTGGTITGTSARGAEFISVLGGVSLTDMNFTNATTVDGGTVTECGVDLINNDNTTCNAPIFLQQVGGATAPGSPSTLNTITVNGSTQTGINIFTIRNLSMSNVTVTNAGNAADEHGVVIKNLLGTSNSITNCSFTNNHSRQLYVINTATEVPTPTLGITGTTFSGSVDLQGALFDSYGSGNIIVNVGNDTVGGANTFQNNFSNGLQQSIGVLGVTCGNMTINIKRNTFTNNNSGIVLQAAGAGGSQGTLNYTIWDNTVTTGVNSGSGAIIVSGSENHKLSGDIRGNTVGNGTAHSGAVCGGGCNGITISEDDISAGGGGRSDATIANNTVQNVDESGIRVVITHKAKGNISITGNLVQNLDNSPAASFSGIYAQVGLGAGDTPCGAVTIGGAGANANTINGSWDPSGFMSEIFAWSKSGTFNLPGLSGGATAFIQGNNVISDATGPPVTTSGTFSNGVSCP